MFNYNVVYFDKDGIKKTQQVSADKMKGVLDKMLDKLLIKDEKIELISKVDTI